MIINYSCYLHLEIFIKNTWQILAVNRDKKPLVKKESIILHEK